MKRRDFIKGLCAAPALAFPSIAISAVALSESESAYRRIDQAIKGDNVHITNSHFKLNGNMQINGNQATIHSCMFEMNDSKSAALEFKNSDPSPYKIY